jgi:hypothetical protein
MAKVKIQGHASGTGVLTVTAPNTSTDRTITLPDATGTLLTADGDGSSLTGVGVAGISSSADATAITINSSEQVGIGKTPVNTLDVNHSGGAIVKLWRDSSSGYLQFDTDGTSAHIKNGGGSIKFKTGGDTVRASVTDNGICFGTDTAAANALDDYEEGTWSPGFQGCTASGHEATGWYTKIGDVVYVTYHTGSVSISSASGAAKITGLPFTVRSGGSQYSQFIYTHGTAVQNSVGGHFESSGTKMQFVTYNATSNEAFVNGTKYAMVSGFYYTDS